MLILDQIIELSFLFMNIASFFQKNILKVPECDAKSSRNKSCGLSKSEVITLLIAFHKSDYCTL